jgi:hypothetical protein
LFSLMHIASFNQAMLVILSFFFLQCLCTLNKASILEPLNQKYHKFLYLKEIFQILFFLPLISSFLSSHSHDTKFFKYFPIISGRGLYILYEDVKSCPYEDVHVLWSILVESHTPSLPSKKWRPWAQYIIEKKIVINVHKNNYNVHSTIVFFFPLF